MLYLPPNWDQIEVLRLGLARVAYMKKDYFSEIDIQFTQATIIYG